MIEHEDKKGNWYRCETVDKVVSYTDSDGVWMKETYNTKGNIVYRENSFGDWSKFTYAKDPVNNKLIAIKTEGTK
jgi:hypothetical protein